MIQATINYMLDAEGQKIALASGMDGSQKQVLTSEISPEEVKIFDVDANGKLSLTLGKRVGAHSSSLAGSRTTAHYTGTLPLKHGSWVTHVIGQKADAPEVIECETLEYFDKPFTSFRDALAWEIERYSRVREAYNKIKDAAATAYQEKKALEEKAREEAYQKRMAMQAVQDEQKRQKAIKKAEGEKALADWADTHGSELLKARKEEGFDWEALARREYVTKTLLDAGLSDGIPESEAAGWDERERPDMDGIHALRAARELLKGKAVVTLGRMNLETGNEDDYGDTIYDHKNCLAVTVNTPDGHEHTRLIEI